MKYLLLILAVLCVASVASAHGPQQFRFNSRSQFNSGFQQGFRAAQQRQFNQFNNGHVQQFNGQRFNQFQQRPRFFFSF